MMFSGVKKCGCSRYQTCHKHLSSYRRQVKALLKSWDKGIKQIFKNAEKK